MSGFTFTLVIDERNIKKVPININALKGKRFEAVTESYDVDRTILYALGVGAASENVEAELGFVYGPELKALPTMAIVLANEPFWMDDPDLAITFSHALHGEQRLTIEGPLPVAGTVTGQCSIDALYDKGEKGAVLILKRELRNAETGGPIATMRSSVFLRADGGFGGASDGQPAPYAIPDRAPDLCDETATRPDQALLYRLSGDWNPLHADPDSAKAAGFESPILQGLCTYGFAGRVIVKSLCKGDATRLTRLDVRFSAPVYPGETLLTQIWRQSESLAAFRVSIKERNIVALNNGFAQIRVGVGS